MESFVVLGRGICMPDHGRVAGVCGGIEHKNPLAVVAHPQVRPIDKRIVRYCSVLGSGLSTDEDTPRKVGQQEASAGEKRQIEGGGRAAGGAAMRRALIPRLRMIYCPRT